MDGVDIDRVHEAQQTKKADARCARRTDSLQFRFEQFFVENPDEELTVENICSKFDVKPARARELVKIAKTHIDLESVHFVRLRVKGVAA